MRLDEFDDSVQVEDQRGSGGRAGIGMAGGKVGCGTVVIALIAWAVFGVNPMQFLGGIQQQPQLQGAPAERSAGGSSLRESCTINEYSNETCNAMSSLNRTWQPLFKQANIPFRTPKLVFYSRAGRSGCGAAESAMGPFYCPADDGVYIDTEFFDQLAQQLGAKGEFARNYVIAHEYGHHLQNVLGTSDKVRALQQRNPQMANPLSVRLELQADCYAGVWAAKNRDRIEAGDIESGLTAAHQIGDDVLMAGAGQRPVESAFTHGSAEQRMRWLKTGLDTGNEDACDTFAEGSR